MRRLRNGSNIAVTIVVYVLGLLVLFPFFWMARSSFMSNIEINAYPPPILPRVWHLENYPYALTVFPFARYFLNTLTITVPSICGALMTATFAAYAFARLDFPLKRLWFTLVIGSMLMPGAVTIIPIFLGWTFLGLSNSYVPLIVPAFLGGGAFNIFLIRQFLMTIPRDLDEAATIDGAGSVRILFTILVPLITPVLLAVGMFTFILYWNDLLGPLIYISDQNRQTISQALAAFRSGYGTDWKSMMAAASMSILPCVALYLIGQRYFVEGIVLSGLKS